MFKWALRPPWASACSGSPSGFSEPGWFSEPGGPGNPGRTAQARRRRRSAGRWMVAPAFAAASAGPTADAGFDRTVGVGETALLDGGGSTAPKRKELSFSWTLASIPAGSVAVLDDPASLQPTGVTFSQPAPITFPNLDGMPPGSEVDIYSLDPDTGSFTIVGVGRVSADGTVIETISGGITAATWHAPLPPKLGADDNPMANGDNVAGAGDGSGDPNKEDNPDSCDQNVGSSTAVCSGGLGVAHATASHRSLGQSRSLTFVYNSTGADPRPVVLTDSTVPLRSAVPNTISARLSVAGIAQGSEAFTSTAGLSESVDETVLQAVQFDAAEFETGVYPYDLTVTSNFAFSRVGTRQAALPGALLRQRCDQPDA